MKKTVLTHRARLELTLAGQQPDRVPVALWRHFPVDDQDPGRLAASISDFQHRYDFDLIKVTPASSFCVKDWGVQDEWQGNPEGVREYTHQPIGSLEDWGRLPVLSPHKGRLGEQLRCLKLLTKKFSPHTPVLQTIFSPMSQAKNLIGKTNLLVAMRRDPAALHAGLEIITETTIAYIEAAIKTGIDGIFFAVQHAQYGLLSELEFVEFCKNYDLQVLKAAQSLWLNMIHIHGNDIMFDLASTYPADVLNWHDQETRPSLAQAQAAFPGVVCGGLRQWQTLVSGTPDQVMKEAEQAIQATAGRRFILGTGCVVPTTAPHSNLLAARQSVERIAP